MDGVESEDPEDGADWLSSLRALVLVAGDDVHGMIDW